MIDAYPNDPDFSPLSWPDDYLMSRPEAEALSRAVGLPVAAQYLAKLHCVSSTGPPTVHFGRKARLRVGDFKRWLHDRMSAPRRSTSDAAARSQANTASAGELPEPTDNLGRPTAIYTSVELKAKRRTLEHAE